MGERIKSEKKGGGEEESKFIEEYTPLVSTYTTIELARILQSSYHVYYHRVSTYTTIELARILPSSYHVYNNRVSTYTTIELLYVSPHYVFSVDLVSFL